jgi:lactam utilization protein B
MGVVARTIFGRRYLEVQKFEVEQDFFLRCAALRAFVRQTGMCLES